MPEESLWDEWREDAACFEEIKKNPFMLGAWDGPNEDGDRHPYEETAAKICLSCSARNFCLQGALDNEESQGLRGGYEFDQGKIPVGKAREIRDTMDLVIGPHQSLGRPKK